MENNKDNPVRVRIVKCTNNVGYDHLIGNIYEVKDQSMDIWITTNSGWLLTKSDCEVISSPEGLLIKMSDKINSPAAHAWLEKNITGRSFPEASEQKGIIKQSAEKYQPLFDLIAGMLNQHCIESELDEISKASQQVIKNFGGEAWATDEDIRKAMYYAFGFASSYNSAPPRVAYIINNYLQSLK